MPLGVSPCRYPHFPHAHPTPTGFYNKAWGRRDNGNGLLRDQADRGSRQASCVQGSQKRLDLASGTHCYKRLSLAFMDLNLREMSHLQQDAIGLDAMALGVLRPHHANAARTVVLKHTQQLGFILRANMTRRSKLNVASKVPDFGISHAAIAF